MAPENTALTFVEAINRKDIDKMCSLMSDSYKFIDSDGRQYSGRENMCKGWREYFNFSPDYKIIVEELFIKDSTVMISGQATGTFSGDGSIDPQNYWEIPAAWKIEVEDGLISVWQLYANPEPMKDIRNKMGLIDAD